MKTSAAAMLSAAACAALLCPGCVEKKPEAEHIRPVRTMQVAEAGDEQRKSYTGTLAAHAYVNAAFEVPGRILRRYRQAGDRVKAGDKLAELDPVIYRDQLKAARADVQNARALLRQAAQAHKRA